MVSRHEPSGATSLPPRTALRTSSPRLVQISPSRPAPSPTPCWPITEWMAAICAAARASGATAAASSTRPRELEWPFAATASSVGEFAGIRPENHQSSWRFGSSGPSLVDFADDFEIAIGHHRGVKRAMRGLKPQGATVDDAVEPARTAAARGRPPDRRDHAIPGLLHRRTARRDQRLPRPHARNHRLARRDTCPGAAAPPVTGEARRADTPPEIMSGRGREWPWSRDVDHDLGRTLPGTDNDHRPGRRQGHPAPGQDTRSSAGHPNGNNGNITGAYLEHG